MNAVQFSCKRQASNRRRSQTRKSCKFGAALRFILSVCVCVCVPVCVWMCERDCVCNWVYVWVCVCGYVYINQICVCVCLDLCVYLHVPVCVSVPMYVYEYEYTCTYWSALGKLKFERAQVSFGVCKHNCSQHIILGKLNLYEHPLYTRQGFWSEGLTHGILS